MDQGLNLQDIIKLASMKKAGTGEEAEVNVEIGEGPTPREEPKKAKQSHSRETQLRSQVRK